MAGDRTTRQQRHRRGTRSQGQGARFLTTTSEGQAGARRQRSTREPREQRVHNTYLELRDRLVGLSIAPGSPIDETFFACELGVSRALIREASRRLAADELVTTFPPDDRREGTCTGSCSGAMPRAAPPRRWTAISICRCASGGASPRASRTGSHLLVIVTVCSPLLPRARRSERRPCSCDTSRALRRSFEQACELRAVSRPVR